MADDKKKQPQTLDDQFSEEEAARRRDEVIHRMANTPPQPKLNPPNRRQGKKTSTGADRKKGRAPGKS